MTEKMYYLVSNLRNLPLKTEKKDQSSTGIWTHNLKILLIQPLQYQELHQVTFQHSCQPSHLTNST